MNTNPKAKTLLCYGDSNTWGADPETGLRLAADKRWPGIVQKTLGEEFYVIEEGLNGRTTIYDDPEKTWKNGKTYLYPCLNTHKPLDLVILMLGTNDVKTTYNVKAENIGAGIEELVKIVKSAEVGRIGSDLKILLIAPPLIKDVAKQEDNRMHEAPEKSKLFASKYREIAEKYKCNFMDASEIIESSDIDGYHLDKDAHRKLGGVVAAKVREILT